MANNCYNWIMIEGNKSDILKFWNEINPDNVGQNGYDLYTELQSKYQPNGIGNDAKWFDVFCTLEGDEDSELYITISGDSAWVPSLELFGIISTHYTSFHITYEYEEAGCDFCGKAEIHNGRVIDQCFTYWKGKIELNGEETTLDEVLENECFPDYWDSIEEFKKSDVVQAFSEDNQLIILQKFEERINNINQN